MTEPILEARNLTRYFDTGSGFLDGIVGSTDAVKAVDGIDLDLRAGETLGVVGESGCGKTTLGRTLLRLIEPTDGTTVYRRPVDRGDRESRSTNHNPDEIEREELELTKLSRRQLREVRTDLQYIFQDPFSSLNPRLTVGDIVGEPLDIHDIASGDERRDRVQGLLETVGLNPSHVHRYPHEFSGGQRQRIGIARALAVDPEIIVCDEPVSALDVSVQAQILNLLEDLQEEFGLSYVFIAHDLSVVEHIADRVAVMYLGEFAEVGTTEEVFSPPYHPYSEALLSAIPEPDPGWEADRILLPGTVPSPIDPPSGCRFHTRCPRVIQPQKIDLEQDEWRSLFDLRLRVASAETVEAVAVDEGKRDDEIVGPTAMSRTELDGAVRSEFDLPGTLSDGRAENVLGDAIDALHDGDLDDTWRALEAPLESPCERIDPAQIPIDNTHHIACLRYDEAEAGDRPRWAGSGPGEAISDD